MNRLPFILSVCCLFSPIAIADDVVPGDEHPGPDVKFTLQDDARWTTTAYNKATLQQGDPTILTWTVVPDGTPITPRYDGESNGPSTLRSRLQSVYGDKWRELFESVFDRFSQLSGLTYIYEPTDDGSAIAESDYLTGIRGVRADIRIGGHSIGSNSRLGYNYFPDNGDMVLDTTGDFLNEQRRLRNLIAHEHGHGLGLGHVFSDDTRPLMQPFITVDFEGPQFDDILALHRAYGDALEKKGGNDSAETAVDLGIYNGDTNIVIGDDGSVSEILPEQSDFVSIDGLQDVDYFRFSLPATTTTSFRLEPIGPTYLQGNDRNSKTEFVADRQNDLSLQIFRAGNRFPLATSDVPGVGEVESIDRILLGSGDYFVRVTGQQDAAQMYRLTIGRLVEGLEGDFNQDGELDVTDLQMLIDFTRSGRFQSDFDLNSDDRLDQRDLRRWVNELKNTFFGDANLDGVFDTRDLVQVFQAAEYEDGIDQNSTWQTGDWNGDGDFGTTDLILAFQDAGFERGFRSAVTVPEPIPAVILGFVVILLIRRRPRRG